MTICQRFVGNCSNHPNLTPVRYPGSGGSAAELVTNFESEQPSSHYAELYQRDGLQGGHVIMLGADEDSRYGSFQP